MEATFMQQCTLICPFYIYQEITAVWKKKLQYGNTEKLVLWLCEKESELRVINFTKNRNSLLSRTHTYTLSQTKKESSDIVSDKRARATMIYLTLSLSLWFIYSSLTCCLLLCVYE